MFSSVTNPGVYTPTAFNGDTVHIILIVLASIAFITVGAVVRKRTGSLVFLLVAIVTATVFIPASSFTKIKNMEVAETVYETEVTAWLLDSHDIVVENYVLKSALNGGDHNYYSKASDGRFALIVTANGDLKVIKMRLGDKFDRHEGDDGYTIHTQYSFGFVEWMKENYPNFDSTFFSNLDSDLVTGEYIKIRVSPSGEIVSTEWVEK